MKVGEILKYSVEKLKENDIKDYLIKAKILIIFVLDKPKEYLIAHDNEEITKEQEEKIKECIKKIISGTPIQYITKTQEFFGLNFFVNEDVLIPRPDTEILVEEVINICKNSQNKELFVLDLCTGSGAIGVSLAKNTLNTNIIASDISLEALKVAEINAKDNNVNITFIESDLFSNINEKFDIIVSNPPYIKKEDIEVLDLEVQKEPIIALDGGTDGLDFYRKIIEEANEFLKKDGHLCLEIGYDQRKEIIEILEKTNKYYNIYSKKDLAGNDRIVICRRK